MRAEAYRSMADERGQVCHLQAAACQVLVDRESRRRARIRPAIAAPVGRRGVNFPDRDFQRKTKGTVLLVNAFYVTNGPQTIIFAIFVSMNPPTKVYYAGSAIQGFLTPEFRSDADSLVSLVHF